MAKFVFDEASGEDETSSGKVCPYCLCRTKKVGGNRIYPHRSDLHHKRFFLCEKCEAYVGCHVDGTAFGRVANAELRALKMRAHKRFDSTWGSKKRSRRQAYRWLQGEMGLTPSQCHIGMFDEHQCKRVLLLCE